jgi:hypothetical protein
VSVYAERERDVDRMRWIKLQPCCAHTIGLDVGSCDGVTEADHAGGYDDGRGVSHKSTDDTTIPLCSRHHREPGLGAILFGRVGVGELRTWRNRMIEYFRTRYAEHVEAWRTVCF